MIKSSSFLLALPLVAAVAGPLAYFKFFDRNKSAASAGEAAPSTVQPAAYLAGGSTTVATTGGAAAIAGAAPHSSVRVQDIGSVFSFDVTPEWTLARWPSATTGLAEIQLEGYRVPLVTGTATQDLAGSLTYYFDAKQKLQRITFFGVTGDPRVIVGLLANRFHLARRLTNDPGLVVYEGVRADQRVTGMIHVRLAAAGEPSETYRRYNVEIALDRPEE